MRPKELETALLALTSKVGRMEKELKLKTNAPVVNQNLVVSGTYRDFYCAQCGIPFLLNEGQYNRRNTKNKYGKQPVYYCSAGHENVFNL